uniref:Alcohol dehydrogenase n=1 Tax=Desulfobacca acetoxidans TaxID=60893 RepID=A0A7V4G7P0_9BACT
MCDGDPRLAEVPTPTPAPGEALVQVLLAGICRTDLEVLRGYHGFVGVMGHEFLGRVAGPPDSPLLGRRVVGEINLPCGGCDLCRRGLARHCRGRRVLGLRGKDGAFAEYLTLPENNLHPVPEAVPDEAAVFTEPLAAALAGVEAAGARAGERVLVVGDGTLGLLSAMVLGRRGLKVDMVGHYPDHLQLAAGWGVRAFLEQQAALEEYHAAVEASGSPTGLALALGHLRPRGTVVLKSTFAGTVPLDPALIVVPEVRLVGSRCGEFPPALKLLAEREVDPRPLVSRVFPLAQGPEALEYARQPGVLKVLLRPVL